MAVQYIYFFLLSLCLSQVVSSDEAGNDEKDRRLKEFLLAAKGVKALDLAGGPRKILEDPRFQDLPPYARKALRGLAKMEEEQKKNKAQELSPRFIGSLVTKSVSSFMDIFSSMMAPPPPASPAYPAPPAHPAPPAAPAPPAPPASPAPPAPPASPAAPAPHAEI